MYGTKSVPDASGLPSSQNSGTFVPAYADVRGRIVKIVGQGDDRHRSYSPLGWVAPYRPFLLLRNEATGFHAERQRPCDLADLSSFVSISDKQAVSLRPAEHQHADLAASFELFYWHLFEDLVAVDGLASHFSLSCVLSAQIEMQVQCQGSLLFVTP